MKEAGWKGPLASEDARLGPAGHAGGGLERYFAREGVDPLPYAFEGKIAVHPGLGGAGVDKKDFEATLEPLLARPRMGKTVAYIHVPFCETHCLYCGFYNKACRPGESAASTPTHSFRSCGCGGATRRRRRAPCTPSTWAGARPPRLRPTTSGAS